MSGIAFSCVAAQEASQLEIIARTRTNNRVEIVTLSVDRPRANVSGVRVRSGSLSLLLVAVEIEFADGARALEPVDETLAPGQQSRAIAVDPRRAISRIVVVKRPGLRDGDTELQVLGVVAWPAR